MLSAAVQRERRAAVEDVVGTHRAEGILFDAIVTELMDSFVAGDLDLPELLSAMDDYAQGLLLKRNDLASAAA